MIICKTLRDVDLIPMNEDIFPKLTKKKEVSKTKRDLVYSYV